ncbi:hypothetical protein ASPNIDRAFT_205452 [Aspergillus niger ATCC 1015]|uniref:Uncharacterized protein n=2 Tax=Aspergillus TaxID=5052 RepID=A0A370PM22_ASPPH|nr:uncharacterized protein BO96DRAFT_335486 [Aspergillus niger CBS 101883]EHA27057.1 hypothetical protein ASPNIDRAFT_205452 [Aspergillus niger ATCC 1015]PYH57321.1 hypothetical protein BO96DRAFT_335486 [Aspergillus niger CBS 101883]RDK43235.1 hypothetical protein M752DRAFT_213540 [Aspergillus phoenicis ATCC 13157]
MENPSSATSSPTKALNPMSPDRMNQQIGLGSPSMSSDIFNIQRKTPRGLTDVQAKVAYLNNLSRGNSPAQASQPSAASTAALQRAILGREEAESALANVSAQLSEAQLRERRISERLESLLEELQTTKERQAHERSIFEKEIRKARKEAFRAGSVLVKTQEELKHARNEAKGHKDEAQAERAAKEQAKQEAFERAYAIAGLTEEMEVLKEQLRAAEANNHSQKLEAQAQQKKNDIKRMSLTEGDLNLLLTPTPRRPKRSAEDVANPTQANVAESSPVKDTPPKRQRMSDVTPRKEAPEITTFDVHEEQIAELEETLRRERQLRADAEGMLEFLRLECHFKRCTCRLAEQKSIPHTHELQSVDTTKKDKMELPEYRDNDQNALAAPEEPSPSHTPKGEPVRYPTIDDDDDEPPEEPLITFSPATGTFHTFPSPVRGSPRKPNEASANDHQSPASYVGHGIDARVMSGSPAPKYGSLQHQAPFDSITENEATPKSHPLPAVVDVPWDPVMPIGHEAGTPERHNDPTKVPLRDDGGSNRFSDVPGTPISREEALAQIRARRERANTMKRSVSASESGLRSGGMGVTPVRSARRYPGVQNPDASDGSIRSRRDMSAPIQMSHY